MTIGQIKLLVDSYTQLTSKSGLDMNAPEKLEMMKKVSWSFLGPFERV